ncbi:Two component response regulator [Polymorphum gilvum SL003B-26A1]|uniref:Two component response regulator n=2 Tax=Polymorphum TaxID=991903 RepID=F2J5S6_POLGS|nr:Two component response regulator [Polymorphum gilvum SL003B-26A1]
MNDNDTPLDPTVFLVVGRVWDNEDGLPEDAIPVHVLLSAPDDDSAVRKTLEALAGEGFLEAELDQIGVLTEEPEDPTYDDAYQDALAGNVAVITFKD